MSTKVLTKIELQGCVCICMCQSSSRSMINTHTHTQYFKCPHRSHIFSSLCLSDVPPTTTTTVRLLRFLSSPSFPPSFPSNLHQEQTSLLDIQFPACLALLLCVAAPLFYPPPFKAMNRWTDASLDKQAGGWMNGWMRKALGWFLCARQPPRRSAGQQGQDSGVIFFCPEPDECRGDRP